MMFPLESNLAKLPDVREPEVVANVVVFPDRAPTVGATPAPPPITGREAVSAPDEAIVLDEEKYGIPPDVPEVIPSPPPATLRPAAVHVPAGPVTVPDKVGEADRTTFPDPVTANSPSVPEVSYNTLPFVPPEILVDPTTRDAAFATQEVTPDPSVESTCPLIPAVTGNVMVHAAEALLDDCRVNENDPAAVFAKIS